MTFRHRFAAPLAGLAVVALSVTACATPSSAGPDASSTPRTIEVENARPTLVLVQEDGASSYQEDPAATRGSVEVPVEPTGVVTFDVATLDTLDAIGAGDAVIGIPDVALPEYLSDYADLPKVGTLFEPDFEAVAELDPDLIVTAGRSTGQYDALAEIATTIDLTGAPAGTFDPAKGLVRAQQLGEIFDREDEVAQLVGDIEERTAALTEQVSGTALVLSVSGGEYGAYGEGSRFGWFFDELGFTPAVPANELPGAEGSPHGDAVTNEFILTADPEWIFVFDRGAAVGEGSSAEEALGNELVERTEAARNGRIVQLPASELYIVVNGLTAVSTVLATVEDAVAS